MELLHQLARDNKVPLEGRPKDAVETCEENPEEEDTVGMQEDIPDTQVGDLIEGQGSGEKISVDKDFPLGV